MKKIILAFILLIVCYSANSQSLSYEEKLYHTCKVWGFVKYYHYWVSNNQVDWDKALLKTLPLIKIAKTKDEYNDALDSLFTAAGTMQIANTPSPDTLPQELKRNLDFEWFKAPIFRKNVKDMLDTIRNNFRPHPNSWVKFNDGSGYGFLAFPSDDPMVNSDFKTDFPNEFTRILVLFKFWNILNYFNPNQYILDTPWDITLKRFLPEFVNVTDYSDFLKIFRLLTSSLQDSHVEVLTLSGGSNLFGLYRPRIILRLIQNQFVIVKSDYPEITKGDILVSVDGVPIQKLKDSLSKFISYGNPAILGRHLSNFLITGDSNTVMNFGYTDSLGSERSLNLRRDYLPDAWFSYHFNPTLGNMSWTKFDCDVGYVNIRNLKISDLDSLYNSLSTTKAMIIDIRSYPIDQSLWNLADRMYPQNTNFAKLTIPNTNYPGTFYWSYSSRGYNGNTNPYKGKVIILCNSDAQSAAEYDCMIMRAMPNSIVVGSQTAGADGNVTGFKISKDIKTGFTTLGVYYPDGTPTQRLGIVPDSVVYPTAEGIRQGRDEVLETALGIAGCVVSVEEERMDNNTTESQPFLAPNPASEYIEIRNPSECSEIHIYNVLGEEVINLTPALTIHGVGVKIDVLNLPTGVYFLKFKTGAQVETKKMTILK